MAPLSAGHLALDEGGRQNLGEFAVERVLCSAVGKGSLNAAHAAQKAAWAASSFCKWSQPTSREAALSRQRGLWVRMCLSMEGVPRSRQDVTPGGSPLAPPSNP